MKIIFDMETGDPDDAWTLAWLLDCRQVDLLAVTITPGHPLQVGFVRQMLQRFERPDVRVGASLQGKPGSLSGACRNVLAPDTVEPSHQAEDPARLIACLAAPDVTFVGGGPMKNLAQALQLGNFQLGRLVQQGGFVGDNIMDPQHVLPKFKGMVYCPTWNLGGAPVAAEEVLKSPLVTEKIFIGKNVCHGCLADDLLIHYMQINMKKSIGMVFQSVQEGKALHDLLAACCAVDDRIAQLQPVNLHRNPKGHWGAAVDQPNCLAAVRYDRTQFITLLLA